MFSIGDVLAHKHGIEDQPAKKWIGSKPVHCDICSQPFKEVFIDGRTITGPWALMCLVCHVRVGYGLGPGRGQKYDLVTLDKLDR